LREHYSAFFGPLHFVLTEVRRRLQIDWLHQQVHAYLARTRRHAR
jgi:hypothetical protein